MKKTVTTANFDSEVLKAGKPVLVDFHASWCGPCKMLAPAVEQLAGESDAYDVVKIDVDEWPELAEKYRIVSVPTLLVFKGGDMVKKVSGLQSVGSLRAMVK